MGSPNPVPECLVGPYCPPGLTDRPLLGARCAYPEVPRNFSKGTKFDFLISFDFFLYTHPDHPEAATFCGALPR